MRRCASAPEQAVATLRSIPEYVASFRAAFPAQADPVDFDNLARAIEAYEATLVTPHAPFDRWLQGDDDALDALAKQGVARFIDTGCTACHSGVNVGGQAYFPFGLIRQPDDRLRPPQDKGRFEVTHTPSDNYVFRAAPLRNIAPIAAFLRSLTGEPPAVEYPRLPVETAETPRPRLSL